MDDSINPIQLLSIVRECEFNATGKPEQRLKNTLAQALRRWKEEVNFVSFAAAYEIQGKKVINAFNRLLPPNKGSKDKELDENCHRMICDRYAKFEELIQYPEPGKGWWPWDILRKETSGENGSFPPKVLLIHSRDKIELSEKDRNELSTYGKNVVLDNFHLPIFEEVNFQNLTADFSNITDLNLLTEKSWQWYAVYPSILGEEILRIRGSQKKSRVLIYLLGTRKEFARRPQNDYGLIVGLTEEVLQSKKLYEVVDAIVFAWNMLAVSPHILEDGLKIARLEAGRHTVHTVRSYITVQALPLIKLTVGKYVESEKARELIIGLTNEIATLPAMMSFVSRRPLETASNSTDGLRNVDFSQYSLIEVISKFFKEELEEKRGFEIEIESEVARSNYYLLYDSKEKWVNELYLISAFCEIVSNVEKNSIFGSQVKILLAIVHNSERDEILKIKVTNLLNHKTAKIYEYDRQKSAIHGLKSLEAFFKALGGYAYGQPDREGYTYSTVMGYNLTQWKRSIKLLLEQESKF